MSLAWEHEPIERMVSAEELYGRYLAEDMDAFEELVAMFEDELYRYIYSTVRDSYEARHLTIEAFAQLALQGRAFSGRSSLKTYLFTISKNLVSRHLKQQQKQQCIPFDDVISVIADATSDPEQLLENNETRKMVQDAMSHLSYDQRVVLQLLYMEDLSYRHTAQALSKTEDQIRGLAYRAKIALKQILESSEFGYSG